MYRRSTAPAKPVLVLNLVVNEQRLISKMEIFQTLPKKRRKLLTQSRPSSDVAPIFVVDHSTTLQFRLEEVPGVANAVRVRLVVMLEMKCDFH